MTLDLIGGPPSLPISADSFHSLKRSPVELTEDQMDEAIVFVVSPLVAPAQTDSGWEGGRKEGELTDDETWLFYLCVEREEEKTALSLQTNRGLKQGFHL